MAPALDQPYGSESSPVSSHQKDNTNKLDQSYVYDAEKTRKTPVNNPPCLQNGLPSAGIPGCQGPLNKPGDSMKPRNNGDLLFVGSKEAHVKTGWTTHESSLRSLWAIVLGLSLDDIRRDDSFFRLGGDSIAAIKLSGLARTKGLPFSVPNIMRNPVLREMAAATKNEPAKSMEQKLEPFSLIPNEHLRATMGEVSVACGISEDLIEDIYPCTTLQQEVLCLSKEMGDDGTHDLTREVLSVDPNADMTRLTAAWATVLYLNPELRTRIVDTQASGPVQVVVRHILDFASRESLEACESLVDDNEIRPGSPAVRLRVVNNTRNMQRCFVLVSHYSVLDGWQLRLVLDQLEQVYRGYATASGHRFNTFIKHITQVDKAEETAYWQATLDNTDTASFPTVPSHLPPLRRNCTKEHLISFESHNLQSKEMDFTTTTYIRQTWALICAAYMGSNDVVFGVSVNGRNAPIPGIEQIVGPTVASVPLRVTLDYGASVQESLRALHDQCIDMMPYEQTGLHNIRKMGMGPATACDFHSLLVVEPPPANQEGHVVTRAEYGVDSFIARSNCPLVVQCSLLHNRAGVRVRVAYNDQILEAVQVDRIVKQLEYVLLQLLSQGEEGCQLGDIKIITPQEFDQLCYWNGHLPPAMDYCVHDLIQGKLARIPDNQAVYAWDRSLSARELDDLSSQLAGHLRDLKIGPEATVPVFFERGSLTIITMLAVLKSGNTCVTLDIRQPALRREKIVQKTGAQFILVSERYQGLMSTPDVTQIVVTHESLAQMSLPRGRIITGVGPQSPAFLMFTSGSTGEPKGIVHDHRSMCSIIIAHGVGCNIKQGSRVLQFASPSFDTSVWEVMMTLVLGGCICVPSDDQRMNDPGGFANRAQVDVTLSSPTAIRSMNPEDVPSLKTVILVGEAIPRDVVEAWSRSAMVMNGYGPAECGGCSTIAIDETRWPMATLGHTRGCVYWLTDPTDPNRLAPIGAVGEILIEGPIIAHGYLNDPEKTNASFLTGVPWLESFRPGSRLYRSGDLGIYNRDGTVVYLGRRDMQVKLRGQRIELGEVESHLRRFIPGTNLAADVIRLGESDNLTAFIAQDGDDATAPLALLPQNRRINNSDQISSQLGEVLPPYMIPSFYLPVSCIPTTTSCKTDRKMLRHMVTGLSKEDIAGYHPTELTEEPSTVDELELRDVWADILNVNSQTIKAKSHFFHVGGDSVEAMKLVSMARRQGRNLNFTRVYQSPHLCDMAKHWSVREPQNSQLEKEWPPFSLMDKPDNEDFLTRYICEPFAVPRQDIVNAYPTHENQFFTFHTGECLYARFNIPEPLDLDRVIDAWMMVVRQHDILRTVICPDEPGFSPDEPGLIAVVLGSLVWEVEQHTTDESGMKELVQNDDKAGLQYGAPLGKVMVIRNVEKPATTLILKISHCIYDGYCLAIYWKDWHSAYETGCVTSRLQYQDVLSSWRFAEGYEQSIQYWRNLLQGAELLDLPGPLIDKLPVEKAPPLERRLDGVVAPIGMVLDSLIKAAWAITMASMTGQPDALFFQITSGRRLGGERIEGATGPLMGVYPVRVMLKPDLRVDELCRFLQNQDANGMAHEMIDPDKMWSIGGWEEEEPYCLIDHVKGDMDSQLTLDGLPCGPENTSTGGPEPLTMCIVKTWGRQAHISLFPRPGIPDATAEQAIDLFSAKLQAFSQNPTMLVH
ncbi:hypothetical protein NUU61_002365 [Penicillium alfredii]|uniref:Carrier domain-containing protein n=1 Tax=Penicillium alfredii TaxID=1506179 RepID=A0A9W9FRJ8_9EURO|nr:uncharacterized protein NUU61_002365 [Penicillium alfredii]KAJ5105018.1 hypothetical protein NUU61_002365 [Penicillium alfredii]